MSQFGTNPSEDHIKKAIYICRYLQGTRKYKLTYNGKSNAGFIAYADSDWASDKSRISHEGYLIKLADAPVIR